MVENLNCCRVSVEIEGETFVREREAFKGDIGLRHGGGLRY
jgi:hypothetical protein